MKVKKKWAERWTYRRQSQTPATLTPSVSSVDLPLTLPMSERASEDRRTYDGSHRDNSLPEPTIAAFSPNQQTQKKRNQASVLIHQKSPLLAATPPQVTRVLAYSHPFILPLSHLAGLLSWTTGDAWESFLLVAGFWFTVLYSDDVLRYAGPLVVTMVLMAGMYGRRYSPLSSTTWSGEKRKRSRADSESERRKSLDEILDTLEIFTHRCDVLLDPFLRLTEFLSTQTTATSATTRPALTSMFLRLLAITPIWIILTLPPWRIITLQRVLLVLGTIGMTWHSRPSRATRSILWRSKSVRYAASVTTGLHYLEPSSSEKTPPPLPPRAPAALANALKRKGANPGVRFTFAIYENQRRWMMLGYTSNLLPHERQAWTDEHLNQVPEKDSFPLPETDFATTQWRWVPESEWRVDPSWSQDRITAKGSRDKEGWTYYDNAWQGGSKADEWGKWTRRRRWIRDAELVEVTQEELAAQQAAQSNGTVEPDTQSITNSEFQDGDSITTAVRKKGWFGKRRLTNEKVRISDKAEVASMSGSADTGGTSRSRDDVEDDVHAPYRYRETQWDRSIGDGLAEGLS
ncbi:putative Peroxin/Ferlin domain-containing protein [Septoria linicola]|nr:putative Peroxin/Ferlin domain-containing protein [Septoria linicola]